MGWVWCVIVDECAESYSSIGDEVGVCLEEPDDKLDLVAGTLPQHPDEKMNHCPFGVAGSGVLDHFGVVG